MKKYILDTHTHTLVSGHAYASLLEMVKAAAESGLKLIAITDHGPKVPGAPSEIYFRNFRVIDKELFGVQVIMGAELNIVDFEGNVDLSKNVLKRLELCIASLHLSVLKPGTRQQNTRAYLKAMENPYVNIIGHPDDGRYEIDYEAVVRGAKENHVLIEVNNSSLIEHTGRKNTRENLINILGLCQRMEVPVVLSSDSHFTTQVGDFSLAEKLIEEIHFPEELIVNTSVEKLGEYLKRAK